MNARQLIEAEDPKKVFKKLGQPRPFVAHPMTWREIERLATILASGPITKRPIDDRFLHWGYIEYYEGDPTAVDAKQGFADAFYDDGSTGGIRGGVRPEYQIEPNRHRGRVQTYYWPNEDLLESQNI